jgi:glycosyltransferase involved in cell wall biosynthesis
MKISVCMATFNGERYIAAQLNSILRQIRLSDEVVISDDCSTDSTLEIIRGFGDDRIRIVKSPGFRNPIFNFENSILASVGDIIVLADQDDVWLDNRIGQIVEFFEGKDGRIHTLVLDSIIVDGDLKQTVPSLFDLLDAGEGVTKNIFRNTYVGCHMAFSRGLIDFALPFPKKIPMHDVWLGLVSELFGSVSFVKKQSMLFRRHNSNSTKMVNPWIDKIRWRFWLLINLIGVCWRHHRTLRQRHFRLFS